MSFLRRLFGPPTHQRRPEIDAVLIEPEREDAAVQVVGEAYRQAEVASVAGGVGTDGPIRTEHIAALIPEPTNQYDSNAIKVDIDGHHVGYLARDLAVAYGPIVRWLQRRGRYLGVRAHLYAGWDRGDSRSPTIEVTLHLGSPGETIAELMVSDVALRADHPWSGWLVAFTGDNRCGIEGTLLDRQASEWLARKAGLTVYPRVTKFVQLVIDCDPTGASGNERKARQYGIPVVTELEFWEARGVPVAKLD